MRQLRAQREAEADQGQVVSLALGAGQQGPPPLAAVPEPRERRQPAAHGVVGEVLLSDRHLASFPALAEIVQAGMRTSASTTSRVSVARSRRARGSRHLVVAVECLGEIPGVRQRARGGGRVSSCSASASRASGCRQPVEVVAHRGSPSRPRGTAPCRRRAAAGCTARRPRCAWPRRPWCRPGWRRCRGRSEDDADAVVDQLHVADPPDGDPAVGHLRVHEDAAGVGEVRRDVVSVPSTRRSRPTYLKPR